MLEENAIGDIAENIQKSFAIVLRKIFLDRLDVNFAAAPADVVEVFDIFDVFFKVDLGLDQFDELFVSYPVDGNIDLIDARIDYFFGYFRNSRGRRSSWCRYA